MIKIEVLQENLKRVLGMVDKFVATKAQLPVLSHVLLQATKEGFFVTATNLETGIRVRVGAKIIEEGSITVPAKLFSEFVGTLPSETIALTALDEELSVQCRGFEATFQGMAASEYPEFPQKKTDTSLTFSLENLRTVADRVSFAASSDESRPILTGILWNISGKKTTTVATDGYRLSLLHLAGLKNGGNEELKIILPAAVVREVVRVFGEISVDEVEVSWSQAEKQIIFSTDDAVVLSRVLDGEFPAYQAVVPQDQSNRCEFSKHELLQAVKMAAIFARESSNIVRWKFEEEILVVSANSQTVGKNMASVGYSGGDFEGKEIAFNSRYLLDVLGHIEGEKVYFSMTESLRPGVFYDQAEKPDFIHVIMPVRVQN